MPAKKNEINLLPKEPWEKGWIGKLLKWGLSVGRYIVVFTELVVISAFIYRFALDRKLSHLNEEIKTKKEIINQYGDLEIKFRRLKKQIDTIAKIEADALPVEKILTSISQISPMDVVYELIMISPKEIKLKGTVMSESGLATLLTEAQKSQDFSGVALEKVASATKTSPGINFQMVLELKAQNSK